MRYCTSIVLIVGLLGGCATTRPRPTSDHAGGHGTSSLLITDVTVVDVVRDRIVPHQFILIRGERIESVSSSRPEGVADRTIEGSHLVALPGFVNTHTHLWQHVAKSVASSGTLQEWIPRVYGVADYLTPEELYNITLAASSQAAVSGITTVVDFASVNYTESALQTTVQAIRDAGLGGVVIWWDPPAFMPPDIKERELRRLAGFDPAHVQVWVGPGPLSFFPLPAVNSGIGLAKAAGTRLAEHTMENVEEQRAFATRLREYLDKYGSKIDPVLVDKLRESLPREPLPSVDGVYEIRREAAALLAVDDLKLHDDVPDENQRLLRPVDRTVLGAIGSTAEPSPLVALDCLGGLEGFLAIHSVWLDNRDLDLCHQRRISVSLNPDSNMYLSSGAAPLLAYLRRDVNVTIGTDGAASNDGIDFFSAMRATWNLAKVHTLDTEVVKAISAWDILDAATINGAKAIGRADRTGSIEPGKEADIVLLSTDTLGMAPFRPDDNGPSLIINSAGVRDVEYVMSDGNMLVEDGRLVRFNEAELSRKLSAAALAAFPRSIEGKSVVEQVDLDDENPRLLRYRMVRKRDAVDLRVSNRSTVPLSIQFAFSGTPFGGTAAPMLRPEALAATPLDRPKSYFDRLVTLAPGETLTIKKAPAELVYHLTWPGHNESREAPDREQLYLGIAP